LILVVSHEGDDHAAAVLREFLAAGHPAELIDTAQFPRDATVIEQFDGGRRSFSFVYHGRCVELDDCRAAWWRRPQPYSLHEGLAADSIAFAHGECHEAIAGLWSALPAQWVNAPELDAAAHHKPYQLAVAAQVGLLIPRTLITNDPDAARTLIADIGPERTVYKTFLASEQCWRETRIIQRHELDILDTLRFAPVIFQEYVPADADIRVTIMGSHLFAAAITPAPGGYEVDYRMDMAGAHFEPTTLPAEIEQQLRDLMRHVGLVYGALDLRRTPEGRYVFLEINPAGEWRFVEERTGQPMTATMVTLLMELDRRPSKAQPRQKRKAG
jgi:hypothetical protein